MEPDPLSYNLFSWASVFVRTAVAHLSFTPCPPSSLKIEEERFVLNEHGRGIVVLLHGFKQKRSSLFQQWKVVQEAIPLLYHTLYVPRLNYEDVPAVANLLCMEGNMAVFSTMQEWCTDHPDDPILILGISLGGRIAIGLQHALRYAAARQHIHTVTLGSPLIGTSLLSFLPLSLWRLFLGVAVVAELNPASHQQLVLANMMQEVAPHRSFCHVYSTTDHLVFPPSCCVTVGIARSSLGLHGCAHREILTHPDTLHYLASYVFPPSPSGD